LEGSEKEPGGKSLKRENLAALGPTERWFSVPSGVKESGKGVVNEPNLRTWGGQAMFGSSIGPKRVQFTGTGPRSTQAKGETATERIIGRHPTARRTGFLGGKSKKSVGRNGIPLVLISVETMDPKGIVKESGEKEGGLRQQAKRDGKSTTGTTNYYKPDASEKRRVGLKPLSDDRGFGEGGLESDCKALEKGKDRQ